MQPASTIWRAAEALSPVTYLILARISSAISVAISMPFKFSVTPR